MAITLRQIQAFLAVTEQGTFTKAAERLHMAQPALSQLVRELEREDRIVAFRLTSSDRPGLLGKIASLLGDEGANILEVSHGRLFLDVPAKGVTLDVTVETRGEAHSRAIEDMLAKNGFAPRRILPRGLAEPAR